MPNFIDPKDFDNYRNAQQVKSHKNLRHFIYFKNFNKLYL